MAQLSNNIHAELTDYVIKLLNINKIRTDLDFVREDPYKLARMINIGDWDSLLHPSYMTIASN